MQQWWFSLAPMALMAIGYVFARFIERRPQSEGLKRKLDALALHRGMKKQGVTLVELSNLERRASDQ